MLYPIFNAVTKKQFDFQNILHRKRAYFLRIRTSFVAYS